MFFFMLRVRKESGETHVSRLEGGWRGCGVQILPGQGGRLEVDRPKLLPFSGWASAGALGGPHHRGCILHFLLLLIIPNVRIFSYTGR